MTTFLYEGLDMMEDVRAAVRKMLSNELLPRIEAHENAGTFDHAALIQLGQMGLAAPMFPDPFGTDSLMAQCIVAEEMGYACCGFGLSTLASVVLFGSNVARQGSQAQKEKYLPGIASGQKIGAWALTEPAAGSDALSIQASCRRDPSGEFYILNGSKTFITNAPIADYFIVLTREYDAQQKPVEGFQGGTAFILERGMQGLSTGKPFDKMGHWSSPTGEMFMDQVKVPASQVLGKPGGAFLGMKVSLDIERAVFGGLGVGLAQFCLDTVVKYGSQRKQFGVSILEHQLVQEKIADLATTVELLKTYLHYVIEKLSRGENANKEAAIFKLAGARMSFQAAVDAVQCLGGYGYMREYQVERCLRDAKLFEIGGGTSEIQKLIIAKQAIKEVLSSKSSQ